MPETHPLIISSLGLYGRTVFLVHENGNWGPEQENSDHDKYPFTCMPTRQRCVLYDHPLKIGEKFKLLIHVEETQAQHMYRTRIENGIHVGHRFDFDKKHNTLWLLIPSFPVVRAGQWNQNNVYRFSVNEKRHLEMFFPKSRV
jgi:hypothetical protein